MNITLSDYTEKTLIWAASGQLPDTFSIDAATTPNFIKWITQKVIRALPPNLNPYPLLNKMMLGQDFQAYKYPFGDPKGKFYCIPRPNYRDANLWANDYGIIIRKDWMENVGIAKLPENMDEFITLMKAFVEKDPDKNGKNDTVGLTAYSASWLSYLMIGYEPGVSNGTGSWIRSGGKWMPAFMTEGAVAGVKEIKRLYDSGGLDKEVFSYNADEGVDKFASGQAGAYAYNILPSTLKYVNDKFVKFFPEKKFVDSMALLRPFKAADGNYYRNYETSAWSETYFSSKASDKKVDRVLRMYDYALSEEGFNLLHYGIKGIDFTKNGSEINMTTQHNPDGTPVLLSKKYPFTGINYLVEWSGSNQYKIPTIPLALRRMSTTELNWKLQNAKPINTDLRISFMDYPSKAKATEVFYTDMIKAVMSDDAEKTYRDIISNCKKNGYDQVIKDFNAKAVSLRIK
jgi:putative aldouronate transport system substrate-binding protein